MKILFPILGLVLLFGCAKNNPDPAWLKVNEWTLESNGLGSPEGELTHNFSDAWVYVDNKLIGVFEVPFKIPLLVNGNQKITIYPTIRNNGISATKKIYPFMEPYEVTMDLNQNDTLELHPVTRYYESTDFTIWDFEDGTNIGIENSPTVSGAIVQSSDASVIQSFNGNQFGRVTLNPGETWVANTTLQQNLPQGGAEVYMEIDYHTTLDVVTGILAVDGSEQTSHDNVQINGQDPAEVEWKKIYIDMKTIVSGSPNADFFMNTFQAVRSAEETTAGVINIDNIKVVHF